MKTALIEIAKYIIGEEINANLDGIHPVYNSETMTTSWKVDSFLCAAYLSIFYLKAALELYRPFDNPRCGRYFLVKTTSTNFNILIYSALNQHFCLYNHKIAMIFADIYCLEIAMLKIRKIPYFKSFSHFYLCALVNKTTLSIWFVNGNIS